MSFWIQNCGLPLRDSLFLSVLVLSIGEIKLTLFSCNPHKSPGSDGLSFLFYQTFWDTVKGDLLYLFQSFFSNSLELSKLNFVSICLIPKKDNPKLVTNYRPISLINFSFKLITKVLTNRLGRVMSSLIDESQSTFTKGRQLQII